MQECLHFLNWLIGVCDQQNAMLPEDHMVIGVPIEDRKPITEDEEVKPILRTLMDQWIDCYKKIKLERDEIKIRALGPKFIKRKQPDSDSEWSSHE